MLPSGPGRLGDGSIKAYTFGPVSFQGILP